MIFEKELRKAVLFGLNIKENGVMFMDVMEIKA